MTRFRFSSIGLAVSSALVLSLSSVAARAQTAPAASEPYAFETALDPSVDATLDTVQDPDVVVGFGPFVGGGRSDASGRIRHASGYSLTLERPFALGRPGLSLGPRLELGNSFINLKSRDQAQTNISTYDNRLVGGGVIASQELHAGAVLAERVYLAATAGKVYSKVSLDESSETTFRQSDLERLSGNWYQAELGTFVPLRGALGISLGLLASRLEIDQSEAVGSAEGEQLQDDGSVLLLSERVDNAQDKKLPDQAAFDTLALRLGLSIGF